eukprot:687358-Pyramimonas_sp.AAC.1
MRGLEVSRHAGQCTILEWARALAATREAHHPRAGTRGRRVSALAALLEADHPRTGPREAVLDE